GRDLPGGPVVRGASAGRSDCDLELAPGCGPAGAAGRRAGDLRGSGWDVHVRGCGLRTVPPSLTATPGSDADGRLQSAGRVRPYYWGNRQERGEEQAYEWRARIEDGD